MKSRDPGPPLRRWEKPLEGWHFYDHRHRLRLHKLVKPLYANSTRMND